MAICGVRPIIARVFEKKYNIFIKKKWARKAINEKNQKGPEINAKLLKKKHFFLLLYYGNSVLFR